ncbi:MAG: hypothetical protein IKT78_04010 [Ruminiclostridium sp.]|nr:hypothetical protein [Ruminiclostridium sp.]
MENTEHEKYMKFTLLTSLDYNSDSYYLIRVPVKSLDVVLQEDNQLTECGMKVKEVLAQAENRKGRVAVLYYILMPHYAELLIYAKHSKTKKDKNAHNDTARAFMSVFKKLTEEKYGEELWQDSYSCYRIKSGRELTRFLADLGK